MAFHHPEVEALVQDLELLEKSGARPAELEQAREVLSAATDVLAQSARPGTVGRDAERALALARMAIDRARRTVDGTPDPSRPSSSPASQRPEPAAAGPAPVPSDRRASLQLDSEIPDTHPAKTAIETSVAGAFAGVKGRWRVAILVQPNAPWWGLRVEGSSICWTGTLEGPDEQSPEFLSGRVREAVQLGLMQAALPERRARG